MKICGYETPESIAKLRCKEEQDNMFEFIKSMTEMIEDKDGMFGMFKGNPQKVMLLPGLKVCSMF